MAHFDVAVVGAGVSGLAAAYAAERAGASVIVLDAGASSGGVVSTMRMDGYTIERGPNTFAVSESVDRLLVELGLAESIRLPSPAAKRRYVVRNGTLHAMPASPPALLASRLFSLSGKLRALREPLVSRRQPSAPEETVASLVERRLGREILDYAVDPFVSGVYAGDPSQLTSRHALRILANLEQQHGSIIVGAIRGAKTRSRIVSFDGGLERLPQAFQNSLSTPVCTAARVERIERSGRNWQLIARTQSATETIAASAIVLAVPAFALHGIECPPEIASNFGTIAAVRYAPVATVALGFTRKSVAHPLDGFGVLVPSIEKRGILGAMFSSTLFPDRAPEGHVLLTAFMGGSRSSSIAPGDVLIRTAVAELETLLGLSEPPTFVLPTRWERGIPQFELGHDAIIEAAARLEQSFPGLVLTGSYLHGVALGECVENGLVAGRRAVGA